ncbi:hypothetical protein ACIBI3_11645 [Actinomadura luteofluorescens]|uniref:hypothetical protein n=1 Tax=Actinomadura luteofluorescens TaxID=46163 RepID=UPI00347B168E
MASNFTLGTPADLRRRLNDQDRQAEERKLKEWAELGIVKPADVHRLTRLIALLSDGWISIGQERLTRRLIRQTRERLHEIARVCDDDDPIRSLGGRWRGLLQEDVPSKKRPGFRDIMLRNQCDALALARETEFLLAAKCPGMEGAPKGGVEAVGVQPTDLTLLAALGMLFARAIGSQDPACEQEIQSLVSTIWGRLQQIAATEADDAPIQDVVAQWRKFYQLDMPPQRRIGIRQLLRTNLGFAVGLTEVTSFGLSLKCPDGANGALSEHAFG